MPRYFTLDEVQRLLPEVETILRQLKALHARFQEAAAEIQEVSNQVMLAGGSRVNLEKLLASKNRRDASEARLRELLENLHSHGCLLKDLESGLVDFPTRFRGEEVYLCWKLGEPGVTYWHGVEEGFRGRKPIDREFLKNHTAEETG